MFVCTLLYVHSSIAIILMGKRELIALLNLSSWCLMMVERLFLTVPWGCLRFVIVVFPDHTHYIQISQVHRVHDVDCACGQGQTPNNVFSCKRKKVGYLGWCTIDCSLVSLTLKLRPLYYM